MSRKGKWFNCVSEISLKKLYRKLRRKLLARGEEKT
jgi:hypothetical protein